MPLTIRRRLITALQVLALTLGATLMAPAFADAPANGGNVIVKSVQGEARVTVLDEEKPARKDSVLSLPARVRTGNASTIELRQGKTSIEAAPNSEIEIPAPAAKGDPIERVIQTKGNAFYNVGKRGAKKLRVETPYLVAVVKGTQFNVAVQDERTTISLFEGSLEIRSADDLDAVTLVPGQIATHAAADARINVIRMDTGQPVVNPGAALPTAATSSDSGQQSGLVDQGGFAADAVGASLVDVDAPAGAAQTGAMAEANLGSVDADAGASLGGGELIVAAIGGSVDSATVDLGAATITADTGTNVDLSIVVPAVGTDTSTGVDLSGATAGIANDTIVDLGTGSVSTGTTITVPASSVSNGNSAAPSEVVVPATIGGASASLGVDIGGAAVSVDVTTSTNSTSTGSTASGTTGSDNAVDALLDVVRGRRVTP